MEELDQVIYTCGFMCIIYVGVCAFRIFVELMLTYVIEPTTKRVDFKSKGKWALVTGSTDGIGKEYAKQLASRGCDIILVSRTMDKLRTTAQEIEKEFGVETKIIQVDFSGGEEIYEHIKQEIADLEIGTLVNNVGVSYPYPEYFLDLPNKEKLIETLLNANVVSVTRMTSLILPGMVQRGKGVLINIGSASSIIPSPLLTVYAATKAYVDKFTEGLQMEYKNKGIVVQSVLPGFVCSNMSGIRKSTFFAPTPKNFVKSAINLVAVAPKTTGYFPHAIFVKGMHSITDIFPTFGVWLVTRAMEKTRLKSLKKYKNQ